MLRLPHPPASLLLFLCVPLRSSASSASSALMLFSALFSEDASKPRELGTSGRPSRSFAPFATFALRQFSALRREDASQGPRSRTAIRFSSALSPNRGHEENQHRPETRP